MGLNPAIWLMRERRRFGSSVVVLIGAAILAIGVILSSWWSGTQVANALLNRAATTGAQYASSVVARQLGDVLDLRSEKSLSAERGQALLAPFDAGLLGSEVLVVKIWDPSGRIVFSSNPQNAGLVFDVSDDLARALAGESVAHISDLSDPENVNERPSAVRLLETYSPVRRPDTGEIVAVAEIYTRVDQLDSHVAIAQQRGPLVVVAAALPLYLMLLVTLRTARKGNVAGLSAGFAGQDRPVAAPSVAPAETLDERRRAIALALPIVEADERRLGQVSESLQSGPIQNISLALLVLDQVIRHYAPNPPLSDEAQAARSSLDTIQSALARALEETRSAVGQLRLPDLSSLSLTEAARRAIRSHEQFLGVTVQAFLEELPEAYPSAMKGSAYRIVQDALAYRPPGELGRLKRVRLFRIGDEVILEVFDPGSGVAPTGRGSDEESQRLVELRSYAESIGGSITVESLPSGGSRLTCRFVWPPDD